MNRKSIWTICLVALVASFSALGDIIAQWDNDDLAASSASAAADTVHADASVSALTAGGGLNTSVSWPNTLGAFANGLQSSLSGAITDGDYFSFTVTPDAGMQADYDNVFIQLSINTGDINNDNITTFSLFSEDTGFTSGDAIDSFSLNRTAGSSAVISDTYTYDVSGVAALQGVTTATEFRIYAVQTSGSGNRMGVGVPFNTAGGDDLVVNGSLSVVPEPATFSLFGIALFAFGYRRFRLRK